MLLLQVVRLPHPIRNVMWEAGRYAKKAVINFRSELPLGRTMQLARGEIENNGRKGWYVTGTEGSTRCFDANLYFE